MIERHPSIDPVHPGEILREDILPALSMSKTAVADALGISRQTLYDILNEKQPVTAEMAVSFRQAVRQRRRLLGESATHPRSGARRAHGGRLRDTDPRSAGRLNDAQLIARIGILAQETADPLRQVRFLTVLGQVVQDLRRDCYVQHRLLGGKLPCCRKRLKDRLTV